ncbi:hypothetical protein SISSUDRAFT_234839 [Sistotremastrum suecicum HHB10207 ss-3]|uniref:DUF6534 domain-containing protein n=1 Tax=Sistotremastrum suecicum HHB10207 ss-3 TaxID=1314776 RepID=A0A166GI02_9AGAM|nr:hypothetical protein SISSUDRAFT_234839 [Sistotremastrum suecicum HHB10207 ss-3]
MSLQPMHSVDSTLGAMFLGVFASSALYGLTSFQMLVYIRNFEKDRIPLKLLVWAVWVLESLHVALTWHFIYIYLILHFSEAPQNLLATWSIDLTVVVTSLIVLLVDIFFVHRIYHLSNKNRILCAVVSFFVMARLALGLVITIRWFWLKPFDLFHLKIKDEMTASLALGVATDVLITASLCHYLQISRNGFQKTDNILNTLTIYAINNGLITSITDILILTFFLAYEKSLTYLALYQLLSKFYANSLLAT